MNKVTKEEFDAVFEELKAENASRISVGLDALEISTKEYESLTDGTVSLVEYYTPKMMFAFVQDGRFYTNGL